MENQLKQLFLIKAENLYLLFYEEIYQGKHRNKSPNESYDIIYEELLDFLLFEQKNHFQLKEYSDAIEGLKHSWENFKNILYENKDLEEKRIPRDLDQMKKALNQLQESLLYLINKIKKSLYLLA